VKCGHRALRRLRQRDRELRALPRNRGPGDGRENAEPSSYQFLYLHQCLPARHASAMQGGHHRTVTILSRCRRRRAQEARLELLAMGIRAALQRDKGVSLAYTSIRQALGQLEARKAVEQDGDGGWRVALEAAS
jgi:hypothetical protein